MNIHQANKLDEDFVGQDLKSPDGDSITVPQLSAIWIYSGSDPDSFDALSQYEKALSRLPLQCELTVVINGNLGPLEELMQRLDTCQLATQVVQIHRYCDESTAVRAGLEASRGEMIVLLPAYVQSDPNAIVKMIDEIEQGAHYVATWRNPRVDSRWGAIKSYWFNVFTSYMTGVKLHDINSGLRIMTREVSDHLPIYGDLHRFSPILAAMQGFHVSEVTVRHLQEQRAEKDGSRFGVYLRRALDLMALFFLFKFTKKPLRFFGLIGATCLASGTTVIVWITIQRVFGVSWADRPALLLGVVLVVLGVQLFSVGLLGELIIFTHGRHLFYQHVEEVRNRDTEESD